MNSVSLVLSALDCRHYFLMGSAAAAGVMTLAITRIGYQLLKQAYESHRACRRLQHVEQRKAEVDAQWKQIPAADRAKVEAVCAQLRGSEPDEASLQRVRQNVADRGRSLRSQISQLRRQDLLPLEQQLGEARVRLRRRQTACREQSAQVEQLLQEQQRLFRELERAAAEQEKAELARLEQQEKALGSRIREQKLRLTEVQGQLAKLTPEVQAEKAKALSAAKQQRECEAKNRSPAALEPVHGDSGLAYADLSQSPERFSSQELSFAVHRFHTLGEKEQVVVTQCLARGGRTELAALRASLTLRLLELAERQRAAGCPDESLTQRTLKFAGSLWAGERHERH